LLLAAGAVMEPCRVVLGRELMVASRYLSTTAAWRLSSGARLSTRRAEACAR